MTTRRDLFKIVGGSAVGLLFTPAPWRLIADSALWSENWPGIPRPARGEIRTRFTHCGLCPAGCAVRARCVGEQPVSLAGVEGGLCPFGVAGHHLPYHPARLKQGDRQAAAAAVAAVSEAHGTVALLDLRPGRTASWTYRRAMAALPHGVYLAPEEPAFAVDLAKAKTVLSLGAPLLDGWGRPSRVFAARSGFRLIQAEAVESRTAALADQWLPVRPGAEMALGPAVAAARSDALQSRDREGVPGAETNNAPLAYGAPTGPGSEALQSRDREGAVGAGAILDAPFGHGAAREGAVGAGAILDAPFGHGAAREGSAGAKTNAPLANARGSDVLGRGALRSRDREGAGVAQITGLAQEQIAQMARELRDNGPALILGREMTSEVLAWNVRVGAWGKTVGPREEAPVPHEWRKAAPVTPLPQVADGSLQALIIDESSAGARIPWADIQPKLAPDAVVVLLACARNGYAEHATHLLPTPVYPEALDDLPAPVDAMASEFRLSTPLVPAPEYAVDPVEFVSALAGLDAKDALRRRADAIHRAGRGRLIAYADGKSVPVKDLKPEEFWKALASGAEWIGEESRGPVPRIAPAASPRIAPAAVPGIALAAAPRIAPAASPRIAPAAAPGIAPAAATTPPDAAWPFFLAAAEESGGPLVSPLLSKIYQESRLRLGPHRAALNPHSGFAEGSRAAIETRYGRRIVEVTLDAGVPPGMVLVAGCGAGLEACRVVRI